MKKVCYVTHEPNLTGVSQSLLDMLDGMPDSTLKRKAYEKFLIKTARTIPFKRVIDPIREKEKIDRLLKKEPMESRRYAGTIMGAYRAREIIETRLFGKPDLYNFEDTQLYGSEDYDEYLIKLSGEGYMQLPPIEKRTTHTAELIRISSKTVET